MTYIRTWMSSKFGQIRSGTTELAALEHLKKKRCCPFHRFAVVVIPEKKNSGKRLQDHKFMISRDVSFEYFLLKCILPF